MKHFLFLLLQSGALIQASSTNELFDAMCRRCQLTSEQGKKIFINFRLFTLTLEATFQNICDRNAKHRELLRELEPRYVWSLLTSIETSLASQLKAVRGKVNELAHVLKTTRGCLEWMDKLLGDRAESFEGSYLELIIKSLSASGQIKMAELSTKRLLFGLTEFRRMHLEREYLFMSKNEELHDLYSHHVFIYLLMVNRILGIAVKDSIKQATFTVVFNSPFVIFPKTEVRVDSLPLSKYLNQDDFINYKGSRHLRQTKNVSLVYRTWLRMMAALPNIYVRRMYYDERKDLARNLREFELKIDEHYEERNDPSLVRGWVKPDLFNLAVVFDFIDSLVALERLRISTMKLKLRVLEILHTFHRIKNSIS